METPTYFGFRTSNVLEAITEARRQAYETRKDARVWARYLEALGWVFYVGQKPEGIETTLWVVERPQ